MAIKFNSFSHYSSYSSNLPAYDITSGSEVINYWRSPYDPKLWYLSNLSTSNDFNGTGGALESTGGDGSGIRYERFIRSGEFNDLEITRVSGEPEISAGNSSATFITLLPLKQCYYGSGTFYIIDWKYLYAAGNVYGAGQYPRRKMLKYGRMYLQFEGGFGYNINSTEQCNAPVDYQVGIDTATGNSVATIFHLTATAGSQQPYQFADYPNEPEIWVFDARYLPGSDRSILRENEQYKINAAPNVGLDMAGRMAGISTRRGFDYLDELTLAIDGNSGQYWGLRRDYGNTVGHANYWGLNMYVGCGDMYLNIHRNSGEYWGIDGGRFVRNHSPTYAGMIVKQMGINGGHYCPGTYSTYQTSGVDEAENYQHRFEGHQPMVVMEHDRFIYYDDTRWKDNVEFLLVFTNHDFRLRSLLGRMWRLENFAVGNGRIYTCRFEEKTNNSGYFKNRGARPYWYSSLYYTSEFSVEIRDISGTPRKNTFSATGGSVLNDRAETGTGAYSFRDDPKWAFCDRIAAGCGRVVFAQSFFDNSDDTKLTYTGTGKCWLYTQDGAFIKALDFRDDQWGSIGASLKNGINFGVRIEIKNNLIFVLAPYYDLSQYVNYWGGRGRMYIYSLDGELLAAFSPINLGFTTQGSIVNFNDFVTDGVDLYMIDNQFPTYRGGANDHTIGVISQSANNAIGTQVYKKYSSCPVVHLKLPETLANYYDNITEMYRY